jgi:hypothetical protein
MGVRLGTGVLVVMLAVAAGGCGSSSTSHTSALASSSQASPAAPDTAATSPTAPASTTASRTTAKPPSKPTTRTTPPTSTTRTTSTTHSTSTTATTAQARVRTAPPPTPSGTPAAPDGLSQTTGYGTYELCASACSGSVPTALRRPLALPHGSATSCPTSQGRGPVKPVGSAQLAVTPFIGSSWRGARVTWSSAPSYTGPVLIRGRQLGGAGAVGFGEGRVPYDELQLLARGMGAPRAPGGGREWLSSTRVRSPGCYAYQVDGTSFSSVIVFRAVG